MPSDDIKYPWASRCGARIAHVRMAYGWSQRELGRRAHFSNQEISKVEKGGLNTPIETLARIAEALGIRLEVLLTEGRPSSIGDLPVSASMTPHMEQLIFTYGQLGQVVEQLAALLGVPLHVRILRAEPSSPQDKTHYSETQYFELLDALPYSYLLACA